MTFLHRTRSFITTPKENTNGIHKPLPLLPGPTACAFAAVENVPIPRRRTTTTPTKTLMRRVSLIFRPSPRKKGRRPPNLTLATNNNGSVLNSSRSSSLTSIAESEDDIRPPSGLGSPVSISSLPPSPFTPAHDENSPFCHRESFGGESVYQRTRAISSPNLLRSVSVKLKAKTHLRRASVVPGQGGGLDIIPLVKPTTTWAVRSFNLPAEVIAVIVSYLPRHVVASLAPLSRSFSDAARLALYTTLDLQTLRRLQLEKLVAALASRPDLTELVHHFICRTWPSFFSSSSASPHASVDDHRNSLLTATFTLALQRMSNLISLTLPAFNSSLLAHHTAFGLQRLTFLNATMSAQETTALFAWLDGQINIYILKFPNLQDSPITPVSVSDLSNLSKHHYPVPPRTPVKSQSRPNSAFLSVSPGFSSPSATPTPHSSYFPPLPISPFSSQTLLPSLTTLHGTPSLVHFLSPPSSSSMCPQRPLRSVSLTINTTLYTGLRPAALMAALQMQGVRRLGLRFVCESVDRRTVEKVLGAVGAVLRSPPQMEEREEGEDGTEGGGEGTQGGNGNVHGWRGLRVLEVEFQGESTDFSPEEALYKTLQATLPRYKALRDLHLRFDSFETEDDAFTPPSPLPHLPFPSPPSSSHSHSHAHAHVVTFPTHQTTSSSFPFPTTTQYIAFPTSSSPSPRSPTHSRTHPPSPSPSLLEQARINMWVKQCPSLRSVLLFSGASWQRPWDLGDGDDEDEEGVSEDGIPWSAVGLAQ